MISEIRIILQKIRHAPYFQKLNILWNLVRPLYLYFLILFTAEKGLLVTVGGHSIRIEPKLALHSWETHEFESYKVFSNEIKPGDIFYDIGGSKPT